MTKKKKGTDNEVHDTYSCPTGTCNKGRAWQHASVFGDSNAVSSFVSLVNDIDYRFGRNELHSRHLLRSSIQPSLVSMSQTQKGMRKMELKLILTIFALAIIIFIFLAVSYSVDSPSNNRVGTLRRLPPLAQHKRSINSLKREVRKEDYS